MISTICLIIYLNAVGLCNKISAKGVKKAYLKKTKEKMMKE